jgi:CelD/BcsL family acetyltransferase involved in cellulose biosynthesis
VEPRFVCPGFRVEGDYEAHLARVRGRPTFFRRRNWLARQPGFHVDVARSVKEAVPAMEDFLRLHALRWQASGGSYGIPNRRAEAFHRALAPLLAARGWLRIYRLFVAPHPIAAVYGLTVRGRFYYYQSGYDPAWAARSPGLVLLGRTVEDAYSHGLRDYDFLRGEEAYKFDWASERRETCALCVAAPTWRATAACAADRAWQIAKTGARQVLPARAWSALSLARRRLATG